MRLNENPIFVTHRRLMLRAGIVAPALIALLVGASLLAGLVAALANLSGFHYSSSQEAGRAFYAWVVALELLVTALGGFAHVWHRLVEDRKAGLWESNRVTPLTPVDLLLGYWLGAPLREAIMGAILAVAGLAIVGLSGLPLVFWLVTQLLIVSTVGLLWLLALVVGLVLERAIVPIALVCLLLTLQGIAFAAPELSVTSFVIPLTTISRLFESARSAQVESLPSLFGVVIHPLILTWLVQLMLGLLLWRGATRHAVNPFASFLTRAESTACFAALVGLQHGLIWGRKEWDYTSAGDRIYPHFVCLITSNRDAHATLVLTHAATLAFAIVMLALLSPLPERIRVAALREGSVRLGILYSKTMVLTGLVLTGVVALAYLTHVPHCQGSAYQKNLAVILMNTATLFVIAPALLDLCRLLFSRRSTGFFALGLFALFVLPYILAGVFSSAALARWGLLSPGMVALIQPSHDLSQQLVIATAHLTFAAAFVMVWRHTWLRFLRGAFRASPTPNT